MLWLINIVAYIINGVVVGGSTAGWFGETNETVSDDNPTLVTPAGWAFSIWGLIFLLELLFVIYQALPSNRHSEIVVEGVSCWFALACVIQAVWSVVFAQELLVASAVILVLIAFSLAMAVVGLARFKLSETSSGGSFIFVHFPIGLHGGWVLAASLVNISVALDDPSVDTEVTALILTLVGACFGAAIAAAVFYDQVYLLSIAWALAGIAAQQAYRNQQLGAAVAAGVNEAIKGLWIALLLVGLITAIALVVRRSGYGHSEELRGSPERKSYGHRGPAHGGGHQSDLTGAIYAP